MSKNRPTQVSNYWIGRCNSLLLKENKIYIDITYYMLEKVKCKFSMVIVRNHGNDELDELKRHIRLMEYTHDDVS